MAQTHTRLLPQRVPTLAGGVMLALIGAPFAWFALICAGYALASAPCVVPDLRGGASGRQWLWPTMIVLLIASTAIGVRAMIYCARVFQRARSEVERGAGDDADLAAARTRFLSLWGMIIGAGDAVASAMSVIAYSVLPHCGG
jgi:hypothetical protein